MIAQDKFGRRIFAPTYQVMLGHGRLLERRGYCESRNKPNLFWKNGDGGIVYFGDMRGTDMAPIWEDPSPMFYAIQPESMPDWQYKRLFKHEFDRLGICRLSFYEENEPGGTMFGEGGDGYCIGCGKDFQADGLYCTPKCERRDNERIEESRKRPCHVCKVLRLPDDLVRHHLDYARDVTITVCRSCHWRIHVGGRHPDLLPVDARPRPEPSRQPTTTPQRRAVSLRKPRSWRR